MTVITARSAVVGATVDDAELVTNVAITCEEGVVTGIEAFGGEPEHHLVTPGFVDLQVNGHDDVDVATMTEADWSRMRTLLLSQGVTAWCPTLITADREHYDERLDHLGRFGQDHAPGPELVGVHLEGPYLGRAHGAHTGVPSGPIDLEWLSGLPGNVVLMTLGPERPNSAEAIDVLASIGVVAALGHTEASFEEAERAVAAGARLFTHCFNASGPLHHREPGAVGVALTNDGVAVSLIVDDVHVHPAMVGLAFAAKPRGQVVLVTDASAWRSGRLAGQAVELRDGAPRLADGTLAGSALTMPKAIETAVTSAGVDLIDAVLAATTAPADVLGRSDIGRIATDARADLVALNPDFTVSGVWLGAAPIGIRP